MQPRFSFRMWTHMHILELQSCIEYWFNPPHHECVYMSLTRLFDTGYYRGMIIEEDCESG